MAKYCTHPTRRNVHQLRRVISSSDKAPESLHRDWQQVFGVPLLEVFDMTEACGSIFSNRPDDIGVGTVGRPLPGIHIGIVGPDDRDVPDGTVGELLCTGDFLFVGYWNDPMRLDEPWSMAGLGLGIRPFMIKMAAIGSSGAPGS